MADGGYQDISALLRSLTSYPSAHAQRVQQEQAQGQISQPPYHGPEQGHAEQSHTDRSGYSDSNGGNVELEHYSSVLLDKSLPQHPKVISQTQSYPLDAPIPQQRHDLPPPVPSTHLAANQKPTQDPRTITTWPVALRYVTTLLAQKPAISEELKKMIANQAENERSWWANRQALLRQQGARKDGQKQLDDVLRSVGAQVSSGPEIIDSAAELKRFDVKVHAAAAKMTECMTADLQRMHIPFFDLKEELVLKSVDPDHSNDSEAAGGATPTGKISQQEVARLQRKMLAFLEEYCKE